ncbi:MAG: MutS2/Smr-associated SH3 domain-containing protein, partial [Clostridia bacterium]
LVGEAFDDRKQAADTLKEIEKEKKLVTEKREKLDESIRRETKHLIDESVDEADEIIAELRELLEKEEVTEADVFTARKLKRQLENMSAEYDRENTVDDTPDNSPLKIGNNVFVKSLSKRGVLKSISSRGEAEVMFGKLTVKVKRGDFYKVK